MLLIGFTIRLQHPTERASSQIGDTSSSDKVTPPPMNQISKSYFALYIIPGIEVVVTIPQIMAWFT